MAEVINTNVFDAAKKFVDFAGLDYFWEKAKAYVDGADKVIADKVATLEGVVGDDASGLVQKVNLIQGELDNLNGGAGSITTQIENAISALDLPNTYEVKGEAAKAESAAKAYADSLASNYDAAGTAASLNNAMNTRVEALEAIDHDHSNKAELDKIADGDKAKWDDAVSRLEAFLDGDKVEGTVDTLKEIQAWMDGEGVNATELTEAIAVETKNRTDADSAMDDRIKILEAIDHDAYKAADVKVLEDANAYADGLASNYDAAGAAATAKSEAIADADGKLALKANAADVYVKDTVDSKVSAAEAAAIAQAKLDAAEALKAYYTKEEANAAFDAAGSAAAAQTAAEAYAKTYTDALFTSFQFAANSDIDTLFA